MSRIAKLGVICFFHTESKKSEDIKKKEDISCNMVWTMSNEERTPALLQRNGQSPQESLSTTSPESSVFAASPVD